MSACIEWVWPCYLRDQCLDCDELCNCHYLQRMNRLRKEAKKP